MSDVCTCGGAQRIAEVEGERDRQYEYNIEQIAKIAELERDLKRARVEMEVRSNPPKDHAPCFTKGWMGRSSKCTKEGTVHHAAGRAAVEAAINKKMEE